MYFFTKIYNKVTNTIPKTSSTSIYLSDTTMDNEWESIEYQPELIQTNSDTINKVDYSKVIPITDLSSLDQTITDLSSLDKTITDSTSLDQTITRSISLPKTPIHSYTSFFRQPFPSPPVYTSIQENQISEDIESSILVIIIDFLLGKDIVDKIKESC
jgi:hypothetical protein